MVVSFTFIAAYNFGNYFSYLKESSSNFCVVFFLSNLLTSLCKIPVPLDLNEQKKF